VVDTKAIFFWTSGIFTPSIPTIINGAVEKASGKKINILALPDFPRLTEQLTLGQLDELAFYEKLCDIAHIDINPEAIREKIFEQIHSPTQVIEVINLLPIKFEPWLVVDIPLSWYERIFKISEIQSLFSTDHIIDLPESGLTRLIPDSFYFMTFKAHIPFERGLLIDASAKNCVQALNHGLQAAIYVDPRRLEREFIMRYFLEKPQPIHRPSHSL
jgi:FMN phosphatase YigB (HAD superfamily)